MCLTQARSLNQVTVLGQVMVRLQREEEREGERGTVFDLSDPVNRDMYPSVILVELLNAPA